VMVNTPKVLIMPVLPGLRLYPGGIVFAARP
jgi:hypothetical protein